MIKRLFSFIELNLTLCIFIRQLAEIRSKEALEKEKTRRDYERLRMELDEVSKQEQEAKKAAGKVKRKLETFPSVCLSFSYLSGFQKHHIKSLTKAGTSAERPNGPSSGRRYET